MCRGFDPLFSLWQDRARSFWGIFLIHQQQSYLLGYKNYQFLQKSIFLAPNSIFSSIFLGPIFSGQRHTPISFQAEYPPRGNTYINLKPSKPGSFWSHKILNLVTTHIENQTRKSVCSQVKSRSTRWRPTYPTHGFSKIRNIYYHITSNIYI